MVFGVGLWALGHLLANATPASLVLFGGLLVWAAAEYLSLRKRASSATNAAPAKILNTVLVVIAGSILTGAFAFWLHKMLIGTSPIA